MLQIPEARIDGERGHPDHQDHHASGKDADRPPLIHHQPFHRGCSRLESASARLWRIWSLPGASSAACRSTKAARSTAPVWSRSEEHKSELQSLMRISYAVFCLKKKHK